MKKTNRKNLKITEKEMNILKALDSKRNGAYFKIQYMTDCNQKVSAAYKGNNVTKLTKISVRKGISYDNLKSVIAERNNPDYIPSTKQQWYHHLDKMLCKSNKEDKYYVMLFPNIYGKAKTIYMLNGMPISKKELQEKGIMQNSFWTQKEGKKRCFTLGLDKIIDIY